MDWIHALLLGFLQGITEYLPVSSSGHLELAKELLGAEAKAGGLKFDIIVHVATVMSTLVILWKEIRWIFDGLLKFRWNAETRYAMNIVVSMIPIGIVGLFFKERIEAIYSGNTLLVVGVCLLVTALLLAATQFYKPKERENISTLHAFIIGIAQTVAVLPGLSRSGSTIATGLLLGNSKQKLAQCSCLMVIPPILGEALIDFKHIFAPSQEYLAANGAAEALPLSAMIAGFMAAFVSGCIACKWMISIVRKSNLIYFAIYCAVIGIIALCHV